MIGYIYRITSPTGRIYIGQTRNFRKRFSQYLHLHCEDQVAIYNSLKKHGPGKHSFEVVYEGPIEMLNYVEMVYIRLLDTISNGLNCKGGGDVGCKLSEETKRRMSIAQKALNKTIPEWQVKLVKKANTGNHYAKPWSEESKRKQSERFMGRESPRKRRVIAYNDSEVIEFDSLSSAAEKLLGKPSSTSIAKLIKHSRFRFGYYWKYKTDNNESENKIVA